MRLLWTELNRFRNLKRQKVILHPHFNLLIGRNGQGKSNFLEAVGYLGTLKSFRSATRSEMIQHGAGICRVSGKFANGASSWLAAFSLTPEGRSQFLEDKKITSPEEYLRWSGVVSFAPEDVSLVSGSPAGRRKALDRAVFQWVDGYFTDYRKFLKVLKNRNALLRSRAGSRRELDSWSRELAKTAALVVHKRADILKALGPHMKNAGQELGLDGELSLQYLPTFCFESTSVGDIYTAVLEGLLEAEAADREVGHTTIGPHRDDVVFTLAGTSLARFGSQGQKRSAVLAFKLSIAQVLRESRGSFPLILLDDVASELDETRRKALGKMIMEIDAQFLVTTTGDDYMFLSEKRGYVMTVENGEVKRVNESAGGNIA